MEADTQIKAGITSLLLRVSAASCLFRRLSVVSQMSPRAPPTQRSSCPSFFDELSFAEFLSLSAYFF